MKLTKVFTLLTALVTIFTMATADIDPYILPDNIPNGLYTVDLRETDRTLNHIANHTINPHSDLHNATNKWLGGGSFARQNSKRWSLKFPDSTVHGCSPERIDRDNYFEVRQGFGAYFQAGGVVPAHHVYVYSFRGVVGYVCAGIEDVQLRIEEWNTANGYMDGFCGSGSESSPVAFGSWVSIKEWHRRYGRTNEGGTICRKSRPGPEVCYGLPELCHNKHYN